MDYLCKQLLNQLSNANENSEYQLYDEKEMREWKRRFAIIQKSEGKEYEVYWLVTEEELEKERFLVVEKSLLVREAKEKQRLEQVEAARKERDDYYSEYKRLFTDNDADSSDVLAAFTRHHEFYDVPNLRKTVVGHVYVYYKGREGIPNEDEIVGMITVGDWERYYKVLHEKYIGDVPTKEEWEEILIKNDGRRKLRGPGHVRTFEGKYIMLMDNLQAYSWYKDGVGKIGDKYDTLDGKYPESHFYKDSKEEMKEKIRI